MSNEASAWAGQRSKAKGSELLVLLIIANHAHPDGTGSWPSLKTIASESKMSVRGVGYIIERLEDLGDIEVSRSKRGGDKWSGRNEYTIPGVLRDGFYIPRDPYIESEAKFARADQMQTRCKPDADQMQTRGKYSATEVEVELKPEQEGSACTACGLFGVHHCKGKPRKQKSQGKWVKTPTRGWHKDVETKPARITPEERGRIATENCRVFTEPGRMDENVRRILWPTDSERKHDAGVHSRFGKSNDK